jgi:thymidylate synthase
MNEVYVDLARMMRKEEPFNRGSVHAQKITDESMYMKELLHITLCFKIHRTPHELAEALQPNLPWAEDHFQERISGEPLNPPPSNEWWPYAQSGNAVHKKDEKFSHTYPERFYPRWAGMESRNPADTRQGIRFYYGDLSDLIQILSKDARSRQAYLPVWFPEDLNAANAGERVPCTLGYHFLMNPKTLQLDCTYYMRSCDMVRFMRDDIYMAGRLLQFVGRETGIDPGNLVVHIANLHTFAGDDHFLGDFIATHEPKELKKQAYNFGAMF